MKKYVLMLCVVLGILAGAVLTAQAGNFCNVDSYGCWLMEDDQPIYIMFWSEAARDYIMGPGSNATVAPYYPGSVMELDGQQPEPAYVIRRRAMLKALDEYYTLFQQVYYPNLNDEAIVMYKEWAQRNIDADMKEYDNVKPMEENLVGIYRLYYDPEELSTWMMNPNNPHPLYMVTNGLHYQFLSNYNKENIDEATKEADEELKAFSKNYIVSEWVKTTQEAQEIMTGVVIRALQNTLLQMKNDVLN